MSAPCAAPCPAAVRPATVRPVAVRPVAVRPVARGVDDAGRHRLATVARPSRLQRAIDAVATLGSLVTLAALLVLAGAVGGLVGGMPTGHDTPTVTATFDGAGR